MKYTAYFLASILLLIGAFQSCTVIIGPKTETADYVIVGGGTAGSVLAKKLSDDNQTSVAVLHNGPNLNSDSLITQSENAAISNLYGFTGTTPLYASGQTTVQANANNRTLLWGYPLPFGGESAVNTSDYARGTNQVYSQWETLNGANWSTTRIANTFKEIENYSGLTITANARGTTGLLPVWQVPALTQIALNVFLPALQSALPGIPSVVDYNDPTVSNAIDSRVQYTQTGATGELRASSAISFLNNTVIDSSGSGISGRKLSVIFNATADTIIWANNKAVGVIYYEDGVAKSIYANKAVIIADGIKNAALLMRSGVGPASVLKPLHIPVLYNNPNIGKNLKEQYHLQFIYQTNPAHSAVLPLIAIPGPVATAFDLTNLGHQFLTDIGSSVSAQNSQFFESAWLPAVGGSSSDARVFHFYATNPVPGFAVVSFDMLQPESSGTVTISSTDHSVEPTVNPGVLTSSTDLTNYTDGVKVYIKNITDQLALNDPLYQMVYPNPAILTVDASVRAFIASDISMSLNFQGHCKMAPLNQGGVVDNTGHVYGVENLIVADNSIAPVAMDGSPMASDYMIADNIGNIILGRVP
ncbi:MAG: GMC family oxidoreductase [Pseudobdellovibrio sp.]